MDVRIFEKMVVYVTLRITRLFNMPTFSIKDREVVQQPSRHFTLNLAKIPPNQVIADFGRGSSVESESE